MEGGNGWQSRWQWCQGTVVTMVRHSKKVLMKVNVIYWYLWSINKMVLVNPAGVAVLSASHRKSRSESLRTVSMCPCVVRV